MLPREFHYLFKLGQRLALFTETTLCRDFTLEQKTGDQLFNIIDYSQETLAEYNLMTVDLRKLLQIKPLIVEHLVRSG
jgi:hypothetical protein